MANVFLGVGVNFGVAGTTAITGSGIGAFKLQSQEHKKTAEKEVVRDGDGISVQATIYDPSQEATFEYVVSDSTAALAITATTIPGIGAIVTVTNATQYPGIASTSWFVWDDPVIKFSNTSAARVTLHLKRWTGTNAISAVGT